MAQAADGIDLDTSLGYLVKQTAVALRAAMEAVLRPLGLTVTQYSCLELLRQRPGLSGSELARGVFVTRQSMHVLLQSLEREGLVTRPDQAPVGRTLPAVLTGAGRGRLEAASRAVQQVERSMHDGLDDAQQVELRRMLRACSESLQRLPHRPGARDRPDPPASMTG